MSERPPDLLAQLRSPETIRERCQHVLSVGSRGELEHFEVRLSQLTAAARLTAETTRERYPDLRVPPHSRFAHFDAGGVPRRAQLERELAHLPARERARRLIELVVASVLLDAGAGEAWQFVEAESGIRSGRSEGLAIASLAWAKSGGLSSRGEAYRVDAEGLARVDVASLERAFQVRPDNPLVGVEGRVHLMRELGRTLQTRRDVFGEEARLGAICDHLFARAHEGALPAATLLAIVLDALGAIWPGRLMLEGVPLGDVWRHAAISGDGFLPLHKLSQWLCYSLLYPLEVAGLRVTDIDGLTGLAEYRNGGLFIDSGVLAPKHPAVFGEAHAVGSEVVVEWRALTVALLDRIAPLVRVELGVDQAALPLAAVLEGGTWAAGRALAQKLRPGAASPIRVLSDGTVF
ncbi:MAG TPA: URC4/urg3 family protein [Polyangiales bacterium]|nr:URC4/urg3 family protein [Polyangiales bacterium]